MLTNTRLAAVIDAPADNRHLNLFEFSQKQRDMQIAGDDPQRQMRNLSRQFNHGGTGVQHNGIASLDKRRRRPGDGVLFLWATLRFFQRRRLRGNKSVERHAPWVRLMTPS